jgi:hypothetical protein
MVQAPSFQPRVDEQILSVNNAYDTPLFSSSVGAGTAVDASHKAAAEEEDDLFSDDEDEDTSTANKPVTTQNRYSGRSNTKTTAADTSLAPSARALLDAFDAFDASPDAKPFVPAKGAADSSSTPSNVKIAVASASINNTDAPAAVVTATTESLFVDDDDDDLFCSDEDEE